MKSLHKKIGAGALVVLLLGAPVAYASYSGFGSFQGRFIPRGKVYPHGPIYREFDLRVPFLLRSQIAAASDEEIARNDKNIVYGAHEIFGYRISSLYPVKESDVGELKIGSKDKQRDFADGNEFLRYLGNREIKPGRYMAKVGNQSYMLQFDKKLNRGKMWWEDLDKWQYGAKVFFEHRGVKY